MKKQLILLLVIPIILATACKEDENDDMTTDPQPKDPDVAEKVAVDRFSPEAGNLFVRDTSNDLPEPNMPVYFDEAPFITQGFGPGGEIIRYYNFDVMPTSAAPIYVLFRQGESTPVDNQLNIINVIPGETGYNDFWHVHRVTVPSDYTANVVTSYQEIMDNGYTVEPTTTIVNCPVVPEGSTANLRYGDGEDIGLIRGWYKGKVVFYFSFLEKDLMTVNNPPLNPAQVPVSDIYVTFIINPGDPGGGPPSGFVTEPNSMQTHNVVQTLPEHNGYSPLWEVNIYDNADFLLVMDWATATNANLLVEGAALVNCPVVWKE